MTRPPSTLRRWLSGWLRPVRIGSAGRAGERVAEQHLRRQGYRVLGRNVRVAGGELDLVVEAPDRRTIVIIEVKSSASTTASRWRPEARVGHDKQQQLRRLAQSLVKQRSLTDRPLRIDIIAVERPPVGEPVIRHHENAVTAG
ncbi:MAG: YraN family protein [Phycisphaeraceae bacterium]